MWKTAFCLGMLLSLEARAMSCNVKSIDDVTAMFKNSPQEKQYQEVNLLLIERAKLKNVLRARPELSASFDADKSKFKNNELTVELLFNIDEYRKYGLQKEAAAVEAELKIIENRNSSIERLIDSSLAYFKVAQNSHFNKKIETLLSTVRSSEEAYSKRSIRSRDDEIVLNSLRLLKDNLILKKTMLEDQIASDQAILANFELPTCDLDYGNLSKTLSDISVEGFTSINDSNSLKLQELKFKEQFVFKSADFEAKNRLSNFKIGPVFSREVSQGETEHRFGVGLSMDLPTFDNSANGQFNEAVKLAGVGESVRSKNVAINQHKYLVERLKKYAGILKQINSTQKVEGHIMKMKKSFDMGVISPLVYLDSYRSYVDYLETSQEAQLRVFETYLKLRGAYVENTIF
ncbi:hypothetical protein SHI21_19230 [Bacteriovorax sp. PP10]|uniref:TolC family protein n=1 Tax=Bacteriovorax antarcticus TaxID=3088717 RepID=A0ABU5VZK4_9BACT|nr:hypothetical protein [Bacteriovorax sp. PP10]MEA9358377.1 hypothetical protein [Bacteriovorax sp. PP10]